MKPPCIVCTKTVQGGFCMRKKEEEQGAKVLRYMSCVLLAGVVALLTCFVFFCLCSFLISSGWIGSEHMIEYTIAVCVISSFLGGTFSISRYRAKTLLVGVGTGIVLFLLLLTVGFLFFKSVSLENHGVGLFCASLFGGALAGLLGGKQKKKRRK